ncbi:MAG: hypothetical protein ABEJ70_03345 [Halobacteriaceae archaeon]
MGESAAVAVRAAPLHWLFAILSIAGFGLASLFAVVVSAARLLG